MKTVWVGCIDHKHGTNLYAAVTEAGLYADLADYCRAEWCSHGPGDVDQIGPPGDMTDREIVAAYFDHQGEVGDEWYRAEEIALHDAEPGDAPILTDPEREAIIETSRPIRGDAHPGDDA